MAVWVEEGDEGPFILVALRGDGTGSFQGEEVAEGNPGGRPFNPLIVGDVDGDGRSDILAAQAGRPILVFLADENGSFQPVPDQKLEVGGLVLGLLLRDLDGDDMPELVLSTDVPGSEPDFVRIYEGNGEPGFGETIDIGGVVGSLTAADLNRDGLIDLVAAGGVFFPDDQAIRVMLGDGEGGFRVSPRLTVNWPISHSPIVADFDLDGAPDLLVAAAAPPRGRSRRILGTAGGAGRTSHVSRRRCRSRWRRYRRRDDSQLGR